MSHVLTIKLPHPLLDQLEDACTRAGKSKGAVLREALMKWLETSPQTAFNIEGITDRLRSGKPPRLRADWELLRRKASASRPALTPEEEVSRHRRRSL